MSTRRGGEIVPGRWRAAQIFVILVFAFSRVAYRTAFGVRFDATTVSTFLQYIDPWLVEHDFARSVLYLHHQAPLQIVLAQGAMKMFGVARGRVLLDGVYLAFGLSLALALLAVLRRLAAPAVLSAVAVSLFAAAPTSVLYETWLFYPLPTALLLVVSVVALLRYYRCGTFAAALLFFCTLAVLGLLRATLGAPFLCAAAALVIARPAIGSSRATLLKAASVPLLVVTLNTAKTSWLVGHAFGTALLWQNLCMKIFVQMPLGERHRLLAKRLVSHVADFHGLTVDARAYGPAYVPHAPTGVALLDWDEVAGHQNSHALEHILVAERYYRPDAMYLLRQYPLVYWQSVWAGLSTEYFSSPATADGLRLGEDVEKLAGPLRVADRLFGRIGAEGSERYLALIVGLPLAWLYALTRLVGTRATSGAERASAAAIAYMLLAIGYGAASTLLVSFGDFARYRFDVDALYLVILVLACADGAALVRVRMLRRFGGPGARSSAIAIKFVARKKRDSTACSAAWGGTIVLLGHVWACSRLRRPVACRGALLKGCLK